MIVDCFTHTWESHSSLGRSVETAGLAGNGSAHHPPRASAPQHRAAAEPVDATFVLGFKSQYLGAEIANDAVAAYVRENEGRMIGIAGIDPANPKEAAAELRRAREELHMPGLAIAPAAQDFHPSSSQAMSIYNLAAEMGMPVIIHSGTHMTRTTKLEYAQPVLLDEVAREVPGLRMVIAHIGAPWVHETITLLQKHEHVFAEISGLFVQPWRAYETFLAAHHAGVLDKLLFGSGFPNAAPSFCIESLFSLNHLVHGTNLPTIPREQLRGIVERDALGLLGIPRQGPPPSRTRAYEEVHDEV